MAARIYIGRLSNWARERDVERFLKGFGRIKDISIKNGYCFVDFEDYRDADDAAYELNGRELCGDRVIVELARGTPRGEDLRRDLDRGFVPSSSSRSGRSGGGGGSGGFGRDKYGPPTRTDYRLTVENLSSRVSWQDLKDLMRQAGEVTYADAHRERKNEGVVEFASHSEMKRAIDKLDNTELHGRRIKLVEDKAAARRRRRSRSKSRSRSPRSRSRSRSRSKSKSRSGRRAVKSKSRSRSRSRSASRSASGSPAKNNRDSDND